MDTDGIWAAINAAESDMHEVYYRALLLAHHLNELDATPDLEFRQALASLSGDIMEIGKRLGPHHSAIYRAVREAEQAE